MERLRKLISDIGGHPRLLAIVLGAVAACGFQPLRLWPLTLIAVALLIELAARARRARDAALVGWLFAVGHFTLGNNWIATAFTYQANMPQWLGWIAVFLLSLYLAVFPMLSVLGAWLFARRFAVRDAAAPLPWLGLALVPFWIVGEWLRSWVFTGFAWNPLGIVLLGGFDGQGLAFLAPWLGTYGLSGLAVALAAFALVGRDRQEFEGAPAVFGRTGVPDADVDRVGTCEPPNEPLREPTTHPLPDEARRRPLSRQDDGEAAFAVAAHHVQGPDGGPQKVDAVGEEVTNAGRAVELLEAL